MFYELALAAICIIVCLKLQRFKWLKDIKQTVAAALLNRGQVKINIRMKDHKQKLLHDGLKRLQDRLQEQERNESSATGRRLNVVEIGAGAGANFEFYPPGVTVTCIEPNGKSEPHLRRNAERFPDVCLDKFHVAFAEDMTQCIESGSVDAVVCTLVLCSVRDVERCLKEVIRILKPGGQFFFMEHICADENAPGNVKLMQSILKRPLKWLFDCDLARTTHEIIRRASFSHVDMKLFDAVELLKPTPIIPFASWFVNAIRPHVLGVATK